MAPSTAVRRRFHGPFRRRDLISRDPSEDLQGQKKASRERNSAAEDSPDVPSMQCSSVAAVALAKEQLVHKPYERIKKALDLSTVGQ